MIETTHKEDERAHAGGGCARLSSTQKRVLSGCSLAAVVACGGAPAAPPATATSAPTPLASTASAAPGQPAAPAKPDTSKATQAPDERAYADGPVTEVDYIRVEYGRFEDYIDWLNSTWKPTMEAMKKAGLIIGYKAYRATPKSPDQPNVFLTITFENMAAALDKGVELEAVAKRVIGSTKFQNEARVLRNEYRKVLGIELIRELVLK